MMTLNNKKESHAARPIGAICTDGASYKFWF